MTELKLDLKGLPGFGAGPYPHLDREAIGHVLGLYEVALQQMNLPALPDENQLAHIATLAGIQRMCPDKDILKNKVDMGHSTIMCPLQALTDSVALVGLRLGWSLAIVGVAAAMQAQQQATPQTTAENHEVS